MSKSLCKLSLSAAVALTLSNPVLAADVANTSWDLLGTVGGKVGVSCRVGPRSVGASVGVNKFYKNRNVDINANRKLDAKISFGEGTVQPDGSIDGSFTWENDELSAASGFAPLTGTWTQKKNAITLKFDNWAVSPISVGAFAMAQGFSAIAGNSYSQGGATVQIDDTDQFEDNVKYVFSGRVNNAGTSIKITEVFGFKFSATGSALGSSNTCTFRISNFGRTYKGKPTAAPAG